ncbi:hypothetical protein SAMN05421736_101991 [Evansella caseinilytica]|uniref:TIGR01777 family protein n=1 Tax=Evansella caseinilytica TaxID=1503961 RepID=A0A1H3J140_9BACI|nr:TIGR01777 family oxidoreductase [Evansella caseinilytica]SDY33690.1 hypothetical protein SAMN05421736_101991 [Evansella caseinilytica]
MRVAIAGGTGFIGRALTEVLLDNGAEVVILTRKPRSKSTRKGLSYVAWLNEATDSEQKLSGITAFVNLAGENLNSGRWTKTRKESILQSRINATKEAVRMISRLEKKPDVLINGSAIGFYGTSLQEAFTEEAAVPSDDFLAKVVAGWENEAKNAEKHTRVVYTRFGMVLDKNEGAFKKMLLPFKLFAGGNLGSGRQWISWIHIEDAVNAILHCITSDELDGPVNVTAPEPVIMSEFGKTLSRIIQRPYWLTVPDFVLKTVLGEMSTLILAGQKVLPQKLLQSGFSYRFKTIDAALTDLTDNKHSK